MARTVSIDDGQILSAAREVFLERGVSATTAEVARRAGVSEGSIFKRWKNKAALFVAAMETHGPAEFALYLEAQVGRGELRETLLVAGLKALRFFRKIAPLSMMSWSNPDLTAKRQPLGGAAAKQGIETVARALAAEMEAGRLRAVDPTTLAQSFFGSIFNYVTIELLFKTNGAPTTPAEDFIRGLLDIVWNGVAPTPAAPTPPLAQE
ncbi:TetR/AcrR family transcriptional regulator [Haliangium sp.]|uniref:TetR/AcrR family transcriptional regulator n=1 Tax=Haliangium sp. TaxID=2663208 RepID=UPI003D115E46